MNLHQLMFKSHSRNELLALETLFKKIMVSKENIDKINTTGHVLNICISIYIFFKEGTNK